jgi:hypothetical protein
VNLIKSGVSESPTLTLHIGTHKTGSSSIQFAALANRGRLLKAGTYLVRTGSGNYTSPHHNLAYEIMDRPRFNPQKGTIADVIEEVAQVDAPNVLISSESFSGSIAYEPKYERVRDLAARLGRKLQVVIYLREHLSYLNSLYAFGIRRFTHAKGFDRFVEQTGSHVRFRYLPLLERWEAVADTLIVQPYDSNVLTSFFGLFQVEIKGEFFANTSVGPKTVEALRSFVKPLATMTKRNELVLKSRALSKRVELIRENADQYGWNDKNYWGFSSESGRDFQNMFAQDKEQLLRKYGIQFADNSERPQSIFEPEAASDQERQDYLTKRDFLWEILTKK